jgi:hypothetical protein
LPSSVLDQQEKRNQDWYRQFGEIHGSPAFP